MSESSALPQHLVRAASPAGEHVGAVAAYGGLDVFRALVVSARSAGLPALADAALRADQARDLHRQLAAEGVESLVVATCNRSELYWRAGRPGDDERARRALTATLRSATDPQPLHGLAAAEHLFRVACGLDSMVLGEAEILGQLRGAIEACREAGTFLAGIVRAAVRTGRMARAETRIGVGAQSVASAAARLLAERVPVPGSCIVVVGTGATGLKVARVLRAMGEGRLVLVNRTLAHAAEHAAALDAEVASLADLEEHLASADAVVGAAAAPEPLVTARMLEAAARRRGGRRLVTVDLAMPSTIARTGAPGVERLDLESVDRHVADQRERRSGEVPRVDAIVARELTFLQSWARQQDVRRRSGLGVVAADAGTGVVDRGSA
jgi:glutamyl-tRNA reductase